jgi:flagellar hook protein FlgE
MLHNLFKDLFLHGEGDGAGAAPGGTAPGAEAAGVTTPDAGEKTANRRPTKAERRAALEAKLEAERAAAQPQQSAEPQQVKTPWEEIKKQYKDEYGKDVQSAIQGRFKNQADNAQELSSAKAELDKQSRLLAQLAESQYGIKPGADGKIDIAAIEQAARKAKAEEYALENGVSEEFAEQRLQMEAELAEKNRQLRELQAAEEARKRDELQYAQFQKHREQAEAFRQKVPGFDLLAEMEKTPLFAHLLSCGVPVENAYYAAHHDELMAVGQQAAAMQAQRALASSIQAGQSMPTEGGLGRSPAASPQRVMNFKGRSKAERDAFHKRVQRGEKIYL